MGTRIIKIFFSLILFCLDKLQNLFKRNKFRTIVVLYYHAVSESEREKFAAQLDMIQRSGITPIEPSAFHKEFKKGRFCCITFDDGFQSTIDNAVPELTKRSMPCVLFIPTGSLGHRPRWVTDERHSYFQEHVIDKDVLKSIASLDLVTIGSHGTHHFDSNAITDDEFEREIVTSKEALDRIIGTPVDIFSFPFGRCSERHREILQRNGYRNAFSTVPTVLSEASVPLIIGRVNCDCKDWPLEFYLKLSGAYRWQKTASRLKWILLNKLEFLSQLQNAFRWQEMAARMRLLFKKGEL